MPDSVHDLPGRGFSGRVVLELEHVKTSERIARWQKCLGGWSARYFLQQSGSRFSNVVAVLYTIRCCLGFAQLFFIQRKGHPPQIQR